MIEIAPLSAESEERGWTPSDKLAGVSGNPVSGAAAKVLIEFGPQEVAQHGIVASKLSSG